MPFAMQGGTAIGTGRGDQLSPALARGEFHWVLVLSDFGLSTSFIYAELDRHRERHALDISPVQARPTVDPNVLQALRAGDPLLLADSMHNDLQAPVMHNEARLCELLQLGELSGALTGIISGSGPTVALLAADGGSAEVLQARLAGEGLTTLRVTGPAHGARIVAER